MGISWQLHSNSCEIFSNRSRQTWPLFIVFWSPRECLFILPVWSWSQFWRSLRKLNLTWGTASNSFDIWNQDGNNNCNIYLKRQMGISWQLHSTAATKWRGHNPSSLLPLSNNAMADNNADKCIRFGDGTPPLCHTGNRSGGQLCQNCSHEHQAARAIFDGSGPQARRELLERENANLRLASTFASRELRAETRCTEAWHRAVEAKTSERNALIRQRDQQQAEWESQNHQTATQLHVSSLCPLRSRLSYGTLGIWGAWRDTCNSGQSPTHTINILTYLTSIHLERQI